MSKRDSIKLKVEEREELKKIISGGVEKARTITRSRVLMLANEGKKDRQIMEALGIARNTVKEVKRRYKEKGIGGAIHDKPRPGAPLKFSGKDRAKITALACSKPPEGRSRWTVRLLADKLVELDIVDEIGRTSVDSILKKTNLSLT